MGVLGIAAALKVSGVQSWSDGLEDHSWFGKLGLRFRGDDVIGVVVFRWAACGLRAWRFQPNYGYTLL
jgi:hypothetical protein